MSSRERKSERKSERDRHLEGKRGSEDRKR